MMLLLKRVSFTALKSVWRRRYMLLFGHRFIASERFYHVEDVEMIFHTPSNSTLYAQFNEESLDLFEHMQKNFLKYAVKVANVEELIYAENLGASYIVVDSNLAKKWTENC